MASYEISGAARPRPLAGAAVRDALRNGHGPWLGLTWGLCLPLVLTADPGAMARAWIVTVPLCLVGLALAKRGLAALFARGESRTDAARRAERVLAPLGLICAAPVVLVLPWRAVPVFLAFVGVAVAARRFVAGVRAVLVPDRPRALVAAILALVFVAGLVPLFQVCVVHDAFQYYGYLVSVMLDGDLDLYNQIYIHNAERFYNPFPRESARYIGTALCEAPFFVVAHAVSLGLGATGRPVPVQGYGEIYGFFVTLGSALFGMMGLLFTYRLAREWFPRGDATCALLAAWLASPLVFFMFVWGGWAHPFALCAAAAFLLLWQRTRQERTAFQWLALGALAGAMALIRPTTALYLVFPLFEWVAALRARRAGRGLALVGGPALAAVAAIIVFSPQLAIWKALSGSWFAAPYREVGDFHDWLHPELAGFLFSAARHGLFTWTPVLLAASAGLFLIRRADRLVAAASVVTLALTVWVYAAWSIWWTGIGFSNRFLIELTPLFVLGLAATLRAASRRFPRDWSWGLLALAIVWNLFLVGAYRANDIPQGIPDPYRVVDTPLTAGRLASAVLLPAAPGAPAPWLAWAHDGFFTSRAVKALGSADPGGLLLPLCGLLVAGVAGWAVARAALYPLGNREQRVWRIVAMVAGAAVVGAAHVGIAISASRAAGFGHVHRMSEPFTVFADPSGETRLYAECREPTVAIDLVTALAYGHAVPQGAAVASVTVYDEAGRSFTRLLRAGIDTAETSYPRREHRDAIRHAFPRDRVARSWSGEGYSSRYYESLSYRSTVVLPEPVLVRSVRIRYLHPAGRLLVADVFLRSSR